MEVFIVPVIFGLIVAIALAASVSTRRYEAQWKAAADRLQLGYQPGRMFSRPKISGAAGDLAVTIDVSSSSGGTSSSGRTRYRVGYPPLGLDLRMSRKTGLAKAAARFGMSDTNTGDAEFDGAFSITTSDPQRFSARLSPASRRVLLNLVEDYRSVKIADEQMSYESNGIDRDAGTVMTTAQRLMEAARALQGSSAQSGRPTPAPFVPVREAMPPPPPVLRPDPFGTWPLLDPPRPPVQPESKPGETAPALSDPVPSDITAGDIAGALFTKRGLSFQVAKQFEERYRGRTIDWSGEVREVIGGIGPNEPTRVTVLIATVRHELFGSVDVEAIASIAGRATRGLAQGQQISLRGTLTGIDAMARRLFVEDARLSSGRATPPSTRR